MNRTHRTRRPPGRSPARRRCPEVQAALARHLAAASPLCARRLVTFLPKLVASLKRLGQLCLSRGRERWWYATVNTGRQPCPSAVREAVWATCSGFGPAVWGHRSTVCSPQAASARVPCAGSCALERSGQLCSTTYMTCC